jgi:hypothetical protein
LNQEIETSRQDLYIDRYNIPGEVVFFLTVKVVAEDGPEYHVSLLLLRDTILGAVVTVVAEDVPEYHVSLLLLRDTILGAKSSISPCVDL